MATTKATELSQLSSALQVDESTGEIIFTGSLSVDSNTLFIDGDANRVGIGTLTPGSALDVAGDVTATAFSGDGSALTSVDGATLDGLNSTQFLRSDTSDTLNGDLTVSGDIKNGGFDFRLGDTDQVTRGDSGESRAFVKGPGAKLVVNFANDFTGGTEVNSDLFVDGNLNLGGSSTENYIAFRGTSGDGDGSYSFTYIGERIYDGDEGSELFLAKLNDTSGGSNPDRIRLSGSELHFQTYNDNIASGSFDSVANLNDFNTRMYIGSSGDVGIGTSSPSAKLDVIGSLRAAKYESTDNYPTIKPSLNLDFANTKSLDPRIDFTRASTATYYDERGILRTAAPNEPRFDHDPDTGESKGLLIEEPRTNLLTYSEDFSDSYWVTIDASITSNTIVAPDGTLTADKLECTASGIFNGRVNRTAPPPSAGQIACASIYAKKGQTNWLHITISATNGIARRCWFDLDNGVIGGTAGSSSGGGALILHSIQDVGNGWYRCAVAADAGSETWSEGAFLFQAADDDLDTDGTVGNSIYIWGAQLEEGSFPTSYIPTINSQVTRVRDSAVGTVPEANPKEGVYLVSTLMAPYTYFNTALGFGNSNGEEFRLGQKGTNEPEVVYRAAGVQTNLSGDQVTLGDYYKVALSYREESDGSVTITGYANGQLLGSGPLPRLPNDFDSFRVGSRGHGGGLEWNESIKRVTCYPRALPNTVLQTLTEE